MSNPLITLVADDDENDLNMTLAALACRGAQSKVFAVHDGAEAMDYLLSRGDFKSRMAGNPKVLLLDLNMPRLDGWEVLRQIKADARLKTIPVVIFTSSKRERDVRESYELGANAYVVKPIDYGEFTNAILEIQSFWTERNVPPPVPGRLFSPAAS
ncbi:MAG: response regulator [Verrucomicrobia bacterium]|nr:response regulator [Verrucomicrobiota bacterium]